MRHMHITDLTQIQHTSSNVVKNIKSPYSSLGHIKRNHSQQYVIIDTSSLISEVFIHVWFSVSHRAPVLLKEKKDWEEMFAMVEMREREHEIERLRNDLVMLNRYYLWGGIIAAHPSRVLYSQHDPTQYHPIGAATRQYLPQSPVDPIAEGSSKRLNFQWYDLEEMEDESDQ